jgi:hypothetical protein
MIAGARPAEEEIMVILPQPILRFPEGVELTFPPCSKVIASGKNSQLAHLQGLCFGWKSARLGSGVVWNGRELGLREGEFPAEAESAMLKTSILDAVMRCFSFSSHCRRMRSQEPLLLPWVSTPARAFSDQSASYPQAAK